jgi:CHAT domain-containing protein
VLDSESGKLFQGAKAFDLLFPRYVGVCRQLFEIEGRPNDLLTAFTTAERGTARVFLESLGKSRAGAIGGVSQELRRQEEELLGRLRELDRSLQPEQNKPPSQRDREIATRLFDERERVDGKLRELIARMEHDFPRYAALKYPKPCSLAEARSCLRNNEVALLYMLGADASYVIVVDQPASGDRTDGLSIYRLPSAGEIAGTISSLKEPEILMKPARVRALGAQAYATLLGPIAEKIRNRDLLIIPSGALYALPFELMVEKNSEGEANFLVENHGIRYAPSLSALYMVSQQTRGTAKRALWAMGDPVYDEKDERFKPEKPAGADQVAGKPHPNGSVQPPLDDRLSRIQCSGKEVEAAREIMGSLQDDVLTGLKASESEVKAASRAGRLAETMMIVFAVHGLLGVGDRRPPGLVLSLIGNLGEEDGTGGTNDGFLRLDEVTHLRLNARVVVLSACQTGKGRFYGGEGVVGLARAFLYAGSQSVMCSLWSVDDEETVNLITQFLQGIKASKSPRDALRDAQRRQIKEGKAPFYWAPFILIGD